MTCFLENIESNFTNELILVANKYLPLFDHLSLELMVQVF